MTHTGSLGLALALLSCVCSSYTRAAVVVSTLETFRAALLNSSVSAIHIQTALSFPAATWVPVNVTRSVEISGTSQSITFDMAKNPAAALSTSGEGKLRFVGIGFLNITSSAASNARAFDQISGTTVFINCTFYVIHSTDFWLASIFQQADPVAHNLADLKLAYTTSYEPGPSAPFRIIDSTYIVDTKCKAYAGGALVYDSATLINSLKAGNSKIYIAQNITIDISIFRYEAVTLTTPVQIYGCIQASLNFDLAQRAVIVADGGSVVLRDITVFGSIASGYRPWPSNHVMLPGFFDLLGSGNLSLVNARILMDRQSGDFTIPQVVAAYPSSLRPRFKSLSSNQALVADWTLPKAVFFASLNITTTDKGGWTFTNVSVVQRAEVSCFEDFPGIKVRTDAELQKTLLDPVISHIEIVDNITLIRDHWPPEASGPNPLGINITRTIDIRACHPTGGRYTLDFGNLGQMIFVYGYLRFSGDLDITGSKPSARRSFLYELVGALSVETNGIINFLAVNINGTSPSPIHSATEDMWKYQSQIQNIVPAPNSYRNISYNMMFVYDYLFDKNLWVSLSQGRDLVGNGYWRFTDSYFCWWPTYKDGHHHGGGGPPLKIILPCVLGGTLLLAGLVAGGWWLFRRRPGEGGPSVALAKGNLGSGAPAKVDTADLKESGATHDAVVAVGPGDVVLKNVATSPGNRAEERIEEARRTLKAAAMLDQNHQIVLEQLLGEGSFGRVYRGYWRGSLVAVKTMVFPASFTGKEKREKMAIMEAAISSSLSHPNVVQTYTYTVKKLHMGEEPLRPADEGKTIVLQPASSSTQDVEGGRGDGEVEDPPGVAVYGWEVRLVLEYCDKGSLRDALNQKLLLGPDNRPDMAKVIDTALDIAQAMVHLHEESIIHSDLKARNILLKSSAADSRGFSAKVADFGLSLQISPSDTHVSNFYQGTMTHMAPEVLVSGKISKASDVYSYGILLWELYTADHAFRGVPRAYLGHEVAQLNKRPELPPTCPFEYQLLVYRCWETDAAIRPVFKQILEELRRIRARLAPEPPTSDSALSSTVPAPPSHTSTAVPTPTPDTPPIPNTAATSATSTLPLESTTTTAPLQQPHIPPPVRASTPTIHGPTSWDSTVANSTAIPFSSHPTASNAPHTPDPLSAHPAHPSPPAEMSCPTPTTSTSPNTLPLDPPQPRRISG